MNKAHLSVMLLLAGLLAACNSTESALNVQGANQQSGQTTTPPTGQTTDPAATPAATTPAQTTTPTAPQRSASLKPGKLYIAPIIGAPVNVVTPSPTASMTMRVQRALSFQATMAPMQPMS